jgi:hypothetical protein
VQRAARRRGRRAGSIQRSPPQIRSDVLAVPLCSQGDCRNGSARVVVAVAMHASTAEGESARDKTAAGVCKAQINSKADKVDEADRRRRRLRRRLRLMSRVSRYSAVMVVAFMVLMHGGLGVRTCSWSSLRPADLQPIQHPQCLSKRAILLCSLFRRARYKGSG